MRPDPIAPLAAADDDPHASRPVLVVRSSRRRATWLLAIGALAYGLALIAMLPARMLFDPGARWIVGGTIWHGAAVFDGAYRAEWRWNPLRSLAALTFKADWWLEGAGTRLTGTGSSGAQQLLLEGVSGSSDGTLLAALAPGLPFRCDAVIAVAIPRLVVAGTASALTGTLRSTSGTCMPTGEGEAVAVPGLLAVASGDGADGAKITVQPLRRPGLRIMDGSLRQGRFEVVATATGGRLIPPLQGFRFVGIW